MVVYTFGKRNILIAKKRDTNILTFSNSRNVLLLYHLVQHNNILLVQIPLYVATKMSPVKGDSPFIPSPEEYAKAAVRCIAYEPRCVPYWRHSVQWFFASLLPDSALNLWRLRVGIRKRNEMKPLLGQNGFS